MVSNISNYRVIVSNTPEIPDLIFRHFRGESDYGSNAGVVIGSDRADQRILKSWKLIMPRMPVSGGRNMRSSTPIARKSLMVTGRRSR